MPGTLCYDELTDLTVEAFLAGPERHARWEEGFEKALYTVSDVHERTVAEILDEHPACRQDEEHLAASPGHPGFTLHGQEHGVILRCPRGRIAGVYLGLHLAVHRAYQRRGFGTALILTRLAQERMLPGWDLDPPAYTRAGLRAHRRAWLRLREGDGLDDTTISIHSLHQVKTHRTCVPPTAHA
jgi:GNAT superfamily N-acetyltransferase